MSVTLATIADSLIEFILSLLQDPEQAQKFNENPQATLAAAGLGGVSAADVCAVAPVIAEQPGVVSMQPSQPQPVLVPVPVPSHPYPSNVVKEINNITHNLSYTDIDARSTVIDQSTNQNIWAHGDVTQTFDQSAVTASGDGSIAAGDGVGIDQSQDHSTNVSAGGDANLGSDVTTTNNDGSYNSATNAPTTTDNSTTINADDSLNNTSTDVTADHSGNTTDTTTSATNTSVDNTSVDHSSDSSAVQYSDTHQDAAADTSPTYDDHDVAPVVDDAAADDIGG